MGNVTARSGNVTSNLNVRRPPWNKVYSGYPKIINKRGLEDDLPGYIVFESIFGSGYDAKQYSNACATRVFLALLSGGMENGNYSADLRQYI